jgi:hypothetical protein
MQMAYKKFYEWRSRVCDEYGNGIDNDFNDPTIEGLKRCKSDLDGDPSNVKISLYLRIGNEDEGIVDSGEAFIRDGILDAKFDDLDNVIPGKFFKQVEKVFGKK